MYLLFKANASMQCKIVDMYVLCEIKSAKALLYIITTDVFGFCYFSQYSYRHGHIYATVGTTQLYFTSLFNSMTEVIPQDWKVRTVNQQHRHYTSL